MPDAGTHDLPKVTQSGANAHTDSYTYDADGNTATRTLGANPTQNLSWDPQGHLASVNSGSTVLASYTYDTDGNRLTATDASGTTLYLPGSNELLLKPDNTLVGTRYYDFNGKTVGMRTGGKISFLITDQHGTATTQIDATTQAVTRHKTTIFGDARGGAAANWQGTKGFIGGTTDAATGLIHLGARDYDPATGRFISSDPLLETDKPQTLNGYTYGAGNPLVFLDPTGQGVEECMTGALSGCVQGTPTTSSTFHQDRDSHGGSDADENPPVSPDPKLDPDTQDWLKKNLGYDGGSTLDAKTYQDWINSADSRYRDRIIAFDKCVQGGGSPAECLDTTPLDDGSGSGMSKAKKFAHDAAIAGGVGGTVTLGVCELFSGGVATPFCAPSALAIYSTVALIGNGYLVYEGCFGGGPMVDCAFGVANFVTDGALLWKGGDAGRMWSMSRTGWGKMSSGVSTAGRKTASGARSARNTVKSWF